jgi:phage terminase small subunit
MAGLSGKRLAFVDAYLGDQKGNATGAARAAGYAKPEQEGHRLLKNAEVRARIDEVLRERALSRDEVLAELSEVARAEWRDFLQIRRDKDGEILDVRMDLGGKVKSLELLGKYHGLFSEKVDVRHSGHVRQTVSRALGNLTDDELDQLEALAEKIEAGEVAG